MQKQFLFILLTLSSFSAFGMEEQKSSTPAAAEKPTTVSICSTLQKHLTDFDDITSETTIGDLKKKLIDHVGIPVEQQTLRTKTAWLFGLYKTYSKPLSNDTLVKNAMKEYQTNNFALTLVLRRQSRS